jgi:hypothetical protein
LYNPDICNSEEMKMPTVEELAAEIKDLRKSLEGYQREMAFYAPPISQLTRTVIDFHMETRQHFLAFNGRMDGLEQSIELIQVETRKCFSAIEEVQAKHSETLSKIWDKLNH